MPDNALKKPQPLVFRADLHQGLRSLCSEFGVKILALVVHHNKGWKILHFDPPDSFHAQLWILQYLDLLDAMLCQTCRWSANRAQVEAPVLLARFPYLRRAIPLGQHDHAAAMALEQVDVGIHTSRRGRPK